MRYVNEPHLHFQNSANIMLGIFFCAVHCFLEIQFRKVCVGYVCFNTSIFLSLLYGSGVQHHALRKRCPWVTSLANAARQLHILRTGISEILDILKLYFVILSMTLMLLLFCTDCGKIFKPENELLMNYIYFYDLIIQSLTPELYIDIIMKSNSPTTLSCPGVTIMNLANLFSFSLLQV